MFLYSGGILKFGIDSYSYNNDFVCDSNSGPYLFDNFCVYTTVLKSLYIQMLARMYLNPEKNTILTILLRFMDDRYDNKE